MIIHGFLGKFESAGGFSIRWLPGEYCLHGWAPPPLRSALVRPFLPLQNELHPNPKLPGACDRRRQALENMDSLFFWKRTRSFVYSIEPLLEWVNAMRTTSTQAKHHLGVGLTLPMYRGWLFKEAQAISPREHVSVYHLSYFKRSS